MTVSFFETRCSSINLTCFRVRRCGTVRVQTCFRSLFLFKVWLHIFMVIYLSIYFCVYVSRWNWVWVPLLAISVISGIGKAFCQYIAPVILCSWNILLRACSHLSHQMTECRAENGIVQNKPSSVPSHDSRHFSTFIQPVRTESLAMWRVQCGPGWLKSLSQYRLACCRCLVHNRCLMGLCLRGRLTHRLVDEKLVWYV